MNAPSETDWQLLATAPNVPAAHAIANLLQAQGIENRLEADSSLLGEARPCAILVKAALLQRGRQVLAEARFTDDELAFLATGQLSCEDAKERQ